MSLDLPTTWAAILALAVFLYVLLDGFDLGLGILFPFVHSDAQRDVMMDSVAPVWDGNETWLVLGGAGLFAAFPKAYAALMPAIYMPVGFMLTALVFRGAAFEFRARAEGSGQRIWDQAFHWGSVVAAFSQGLILGTLVQGVTLEQGRFAGDMFDWVTPFSVVTGCALVWGYVLLGAGWLVIKAEGDLLAWARQAARIAALVVIGMLLVVTLWVPALDSPAAARWGVGYFHVDVSRLAWLAPVPVLVLVLIGRLLIGLRRGDSLSPYLCAVGIFALGYLGLLLSFYPYLVPYALTIHESAAAPNAQRLLLVGTLFLLPVILGYTAYVYWVFRGKVDAGYH